MYSGKGEQMKAGVKGFTWYTKQFLAQLEFRFVFFFFSLSLLSCAVGNSSTPPASVHESAVVKQKYLKALIQILPLSKHQVMNQNSKLSFPSLKPTCSGSFNMKDNSLGHVVAVISILDHFSSLW